MFKINDRVIHRHSGDYGFIRSLAGSEASVLFDGNKLAEQIYTDDLIRDKVGVSSSKSGALNSSCIIYAEYSDDNHKFGTGIVIHPGKILTAAECVSYGLTGSPVDKDRAKVWVIANGQAHECKIESADSILNLAVLDAPSIQAQPVCWKPAGGQIGDNVVLIGNSKNKRHNKTVGGHVMSQHKKMFTNDKAPKLHIINADCTIDSSGGLVIDQDSDEVIGMLISIIADSKGNGLNTMIPGEVIVQWLDEQGIPFLKGNNSHKQNCVLTSFKEREFFVFDKAKQSLLKASTNNDGFTQRRDWDAEKEFVEKCLKESGLADLSEKYIFIGVL
jgi:hypothetical protein